MPPRGVIILVCFPRKNNVSSLEMREVIDPFFESLLIEKRESPWALAEEGKKKEYQHERGRGPQATWPCPRLCQGPAGRTVPPGTYSVILHRTVSVAGPIEEHVTCFFIEFESQRGLLRLQGFLDGCLDGTETGVEGREAFQIATEAAGVRP